MNGDYQRQAITTAIYKDKIRTIVQELLYKTPQDVAEEKLVELLSFAYTVLGLVGEAGEIANKAKKVIRDGAGKITEEFKNDIKSESGDIFWYQANLATELGFTIYEAMEQNLEKLFGRKERGTLSGSGDKR